MLRRKLFIFLALSINAPAIAQLPAINLGGSNILDGGPLRPLPGWYWQEFLQTYHSDQIRDASGNCVPGAPILSTCTLTSYLARQTKIIGPLKGHFGIDITLPAVLKAKLSTLHTEQSVSGLGDIRLGLYTQWPMHVRKGNKPLFAHRLEFAFGFPSGSFDPARPINPSCGFYFFNPYWAATLYANSQLSASVRIAYLWNAKNPKNQIQAGQVFHGNYDIAWSPFKHLWIAFAGYFLQQFTNDKRCGVEIPHSKERVVGVGPGLLYSAAKHTHLFTYLYFETGARNRSQGTRFIFRFFQYF
jgi:hypothetical protein